MEKKYYLGLDIGGTKVEGAIATLNKEDHLISVLAKKRILCAHEVTQFVDALIDLIENLLTEAAITLSDLSGIGLGLPGSLDPKTKIMLNGNTQFLVGVDLVSELRKKLNTSIPIYTENDANLFALAEAWGGVGKHYALTKKVSYSDWNHAWYRSRGGICCSWRDLERCKRIST